MKCWLYQLILYEGCGEGFYDYRHCIWLSRQYPGNSILWVDFFFDWAFAERYSIIFFLPNCLLPIHWTESQFCCDIKDDVRAKARERSACRGAAVAGELGAKGGIGAGRGSVVTGCRPAVHQWDEWDECSCSNLVRVIGHCLPDQSQMIRWMQGQAESPGSVRHRLGNDTRRYKPTNRVAQAKTRAHSGV